MTMSKSNLILRDLLKTLLYGLVCSTALAAIIAIIAVLAKGHLDEGLEIAKNTIMVIGALGLFVVAGMLIAKGTKPEHFEGKESFRKHFQIFGYKTVILFGSVSFLLTGALLDAWIRSIA